MLSQHMFPQLQTDYINKVFIFPVTQGVTGLFKGLLTPFSIAVPLVACNFWTLTLGRKIQMSNPHRTPTYVKSHTPVVLLLVKALTL